MSSLASASAALKLLDVLQNFPAHGTEMLNKKFVRLAECSMLRQTSQQLLLLSFHGRQICKVGISTALTDGYTMSFKQPTCSSACRSFPPPFRVRMVDKRLRSPLLGTGNFCL
eukprot:6186105-Pleurochrysis_carterae.AAC.1